MQRHDRRTAGRAQSRPTQRGAVSDVDMESPMWTTCRSAVARRVQRSAGHPSFAAIPAARPCTLPAHSGCSAAGDAGGEAKVENDQIVDCGGGRGPRCARCAHRTAQRVEHLEHCQCGQWTCAGSFTMWRVLGGDSVLTDSKRGPCPLGGLSNG
eukprot:scaffold2437_cov68-Phaeocystis_antarctica.AAC.3